MADYLNGLFFKELLAETAVSSTIKGDGDIPVQKPEKFIELGNASCAPVSLAPYQIWSEKVGLLFSFGPADVLNPGDAATIVERTTDTLPSGFYCIDTDLSLIHI